jgi:hypothetical protein
MMCVGDLVTMSESDDTYEFAFRSYGVSVCVASNDRKDIDEFRRQLSSNFPETPEEIPVSQSEHRFVLTRKVGGKDELLKNGEFAGRQVNDEELLTGMISLARLTVAEFAPGLTFIHAGVVAIDDMAIVIPGRSCSGKTTLVAEFVRTGAVYYSDEYAVFDPNGLVRPFAKPLSLRLSDNKDQTDVSVASIGGKAGTEPIPISTVIITKFEPQAFWSPQRLTSGLGVLELTANAISIRSRPATTIEILSRVAENARFLRSPRGEAAEAVHLIRTELKSTQNARIE